MPANPWTRRTRTRYGGWDTRWKELNGEYAAMASVYQSFGADFTAPYEAETASQLNSWFSAGWHGSGDLAPGFPLRGSIADATFPPYEFPEEREGEEAAEARGLFLGAIGNRIYYCMRLIGQMGELMNFYNVGTGGKGGLMFRPEEEGGD